MRLLVVTFVLNELVKRRSMQKQKQNKKRPDITCMCKHTVIILADQLIDNKEIKTKMQRIVIY